MRIYETTFVLSPQADDAAFDRQIKSVTELIQKYEGKVLEEDRWGIRRLAYPIKKFTQGYYTRCVFEGNNNLLTELERFYRIEESYIRHLTVAFEGELSEAGTIRRDSHRPAVEIDRDSESTDDESEKVSDEDSSDDDSGDDDSSDDDSDNEEL
nr:30S ribosomal protein S6 [candidate division Zixibacteria bacterium]